MSLRHLFLAIFAISPFSITHQIKAQGCAPAMYAWNYKNNETTLNEEWLHNYVKNVWDRFANRPQCYSIQETIFNTNTGLGATLDSENVIKIWKMTQNNPTEKEFFVIQTIEDQKPRNLSFSPSGTIFAYHTDNADHIQNVLKLAMLNNRNMFEVFQTLEADTTALCIGCYGSIAFDASETIMAAGHTLPSEDPTLPDLCSIKIFARGKDNSFQLIQEIPVTAELGQMINTVALSPDGTFLGYCFFGDSETTLLTRTAENNFEFYKKITCEAEKLSALLSQSQDFI